eukprot:SAG11_NODE_427_length_9558_cov_4.909398_2_plen_154_part_00
MRAEAVVAPLQHIPHPHLEQYCAYQSLSKLKASALLLPVDRQPHSDRRGNARPLAPLCPRTPTTAAQLQLWRLSGLHATAGPISLRVSRPCVRRSIFCGLFDIFSFAFGLADRVVRSLCAAVLRNKRWFRGAVARRLHFEHLTNAEKTKEAAP